MPSDAVGPGGARTTGPPGNLPPGVWGSAAVPPPPATPPVHRRSRGGCGSSVAVLLVVVAVLGGLVAGAVILVERYRASSPSHQRAERIDDLRAVCDGTGIVDVPAYRRGAGGQLGARLASEELATDDDPDDADVVAFALVPGSPADPDAVLEARVMACTVITPTKTEACAFRDPTKPPSPFAGNVMADWVTRTSTELRIVDVHSGKDLQTSSFETSSSCPTSLAVGADNSYDQRLPLDEIARQTEAQVALFHQG